MSSPRQVLPVLVLAALLTACGQGGGTAPETTGPVRADNDSILRMLELSEEMPAEFDRNGQTVCSVMRTTEVTFDTYMVKDTYASAGALDAYYWSLLGVSEWCPDLMGDAR